MVQVSPAIVSQSTASDLDRIESTLLAVAREVARADLAKLEITMADNGDPTTTLDRRINQIIHEMLPREGEGWLSEETSDTPTRRNYRRVWIVDPIDGTREFVEGVPEWAVSIGLSIDNEAVAGGVLNPCTGELFLGFIADGTRIIQLKEAHCAAQTQHKACVLVSRREFFENKWTSHVDSGLHIRPVGSIAARLPRVPAGIVFATPYFVARTPMDVSPRGAFIPALA